MLGSKMWLNALQHSALGVWLTSMLNDSYMTALSVLTVVLRIRSRYYFS